MARAAKIFQTLKKSLTLWIGFSICLIAILFTPHLSGIQLLDLKLLDVQFNLKRKIQPVIAENDVVIVGFDETTYKSFNEPFALWHAHIGEAFKALAKARPSVVGLDFSLPEKSYNSVVPKIDQQLLSGILQLKSVSKLILGLVILNNGQQRDIYAPYISVAGKDNLAFTLVKKDQDRVVRRFEPSLGNNDNTLPTLAYQMVTKMGYQAHAGIIDYSLGSAFDYMPMQELIRLGKENKLDTLQQRFANRAVLFGTMLPFEDRHYLPVNLAGWENNNNNFVPGTLIHAQIVRSILNSRILKPVTNYTLVIIAAIISLLWWLRLSSGYALALGIVILSILLATQYSLLTLGYYLPIASLVSASLLAILGRYSIELGFSMLERQHLKNVFSGYASPQIIDEILSGRLDPSIDGKKMEVCIMFSDIRNFTTISEHLPPEKVVSFLNRYLDSMSEAIHYHNGTVIDFMGDGIMAAFGAPAALEAPVKDAFFSAQRKMANLEKLNSSLAEEFELSTLEIGIGLHRGEAIVGNIGSEQRYQYTAIGDVTNTASRLEGLTKTFHYPVIMSKTFVEALPAEIKLDDLGMAKVKGRSDIHIFGWPPKKIDEK